MFIPSLSWQNIRFSATMARKRRVSQSPDSLDDLVRLAKVFELIVVSSVPPGTGGIGCPGTGFALPHATSHIALQACRHSVIAVWLQPGWCLEQDGQPARHLDCVPSGPWQEPQAPAPVVVTLT